MRFAAPFLVGKTMMGSMTYPLDERIVELQAGVRLGKGALVQTEGTSSGIPNPEVDGRD